MSSAIVDQLQKQNEEELSHLREEIERLGTLQDDGSYVVKFGVMFNDHRVANIFEALAATLKMAKKKGIVTYDSPLLLQGAHDNVDIVLKPL